MFKLRVAAVASVAMLAVGYGSAPALAGVDTNLVYTNNLERRAGAGQFIANGDRLDVCDLDADGYSVYAGVVHNRTGITLFSDVNTVGDGTCIGTSKNLVEGTEVFVKVCLFRNGRQVTSTCRNSTRGYA
ncbi:hypothetical protein ABZ330_10355 [Streptomyces sp. NPDC006172]|uniref:hypothetical protein n=1 Tax=Streptomyces sp. NPDC006172 TaxID=3154470 RepID=UPI0034101DC9